MREQSLNFLRTLVNTPSPTGHEVRGQRVWLDYVKPFADETFSDAYGNCVAVLNPAKGGSGSPRLMLAAHADEIAMAVNYITDEGFIHVRKMGGVDAAITKAQRVVIHTSRQGGSPVKGVVGNVAPHLMKEDKDPQPPKIHDLFIDIGAGNRKEAEKLVQIGDPITEKGLVDVLLPARDRGLYTAITDCGAGGLSSAVGEMASSIGADVDLAHVHLKYPGLTPWEIWLSEAQERMVVAVPPANLLALQELCDIYNTELTDIGEFTGSGRLVVRYVNKVVLDLANEFLHEGIPQRQLIAIFSTPSLALPSPDGKGLGGGSLAETLLKLLSHPNIASKAPIIHLYDYEVQGGTVVKPLAGLEADAPSDAAVVKPICTTGKTGIVLSNGINPEYSKRDAYRMALAVLDEAIRNAVAVGADPARIALLDNFCWGDPLRPETLGSLVEAARGCHDGALLFNTPFISGKDSLNNEYLGTDGQRHAIPPTLLISAIGLIPDIAKAITMDLKQAGNWFYLVGDFAPTFGGSHFDLLSSNFSHDPVPALAPITPKVYRALHTCTKQGLIRSCHDLSEGGLAVAAAEMCIGGRLGLDLDLGPRDPVQGLFGETTGCLLVEVELEKSEAFEALFTGLPVVHLGTVIDAPTLSIRTNTELQITIPIPALVSAWNTPLQ